MITITNILDCEALLPDVQAVIFDLDDTLYSEKDYIRSGYRAIAAEFPGIATMDRQLWDAFERGLPAIDAVLEAEDIATVENKAKALHIYRNHVPDIQAYPGIHQLLERLCRDKTLGLITDGRPEGQWAKISALNIARFFTRIIVTDELGGAYFRKPNEYAFRLMQQAMAVPFEKMVYIGDNARKDFIAPQNLGMHTIWYRNQDGLYAE